jgi:hypothetical protein
VTKDEALEIIDQALSELGFERSPTGENLSRVRQVADDGAHVVSRRTAKEIADSQ